MALLNRTEAAGKPEAIKSPATTLTLGSAAAATIATLVTAFNDSFREIFGETAGANIKAAVLIAVIGAWALVAVADIVGRAIAKAATERAAGLKASAEIAAKGTAPSISPMPTAVPARNLDGRDEEGFLAVATRTVDGVHQVMLVKAGRAAVWVPYEKVEFPAGTPESATQPPDPSDDTP
jgi:hypothetical protein